MINKKKVLTLFASFILLVLLVNFVSAGLCRGSDGYYHDCDSFSDRYYRNNFYENYEIEYYKESSSSSYESEYYKEDRYGYEEEKTYSYEESSYEKYEKKRDYSSPRKSKTYYKDKYSDYRGSKNYNYKYDDYDYYDKKKKYDYYEYDDEPQLVVFVNKVEPIHLKKRSLSEDKREKANWEYEYSPSHEWSDWKNAKPYRSRDYNNKQKDDYYYKPRWNSYKQEYNWKY